jgi:hypothetical protein
MMRELFGEVLKHQLQYSSTNTPEMQRRGQIIRKELPEALRVLEPRLRKALGSTGEDLSIEGRDGTGLKAEVPWVRFFSKSRSPSAQNGWYAVFLFHAHGEGAYLWLGCGSTQTEAGSYVARDEAEVYAQLNWARALLGDAIAANERLLPTIELGSKGPLPQAYEKSALAGFWYPKDALPFDAVIEADCIAMAALLAILYNAGDLGWQPSAPAPDVVAAIKAAAVISGGGRPSGQGFGLSHKERQTVEKHAMQTAAAYLRAQGFRVEDVSAKQSFDFLAKREDETLFVEVKGTTGPPGSVLLTANEVELHRTRYPNNALIIVHSIQLDRSGDHPRASGGALKQVSPWRIEDDRLRALAYQYQV